MKIRAINNKLPFVLVLACLIMMMCTMQHAFLLNTKLSNVPSKPTYLEQMNYQAVSSDSFVTDSALSSLTCELSKKSLSFSLGLLLFLCFFSVVGILAWLLVLLQHKTSVAFINNIIRPPRQRIHLRHCVFRE